MTGSMIHLDHPLVVGAGVSGLSVALELPEATVLAPGMGSTWLAQGGVAAAVDPDDDPRLHAADTRAVAGGLTVDEAVDILCHGGPGAVGRLVELGARFDRDAGGGLRLGLEAGHSRRRIVSCGGDSVGREVTRVLGRAARSSRRVHLLDGWRAIELVRTGDGVAGVVALDDRLGEVVISARGVVIASGGAGGVYARTTNPPDVHGAGISLAGRAGARLVDLEFVQFHPTALDVGLDPMPLVTEALRGAGARLVDETGHRFVADAHPAAELAPRDVVARAVWLHARAGHGVFLDATEVADAVERFPTVAAAASAAELDLARDPVPISPAAHYSMGGIATDTHGRTNLPGLWAVGEAACTGAHGANRLASNSLLEGLVFAARVAADVTDRRHTLNGNPTPEPETGLDFDGSAPEELARLRRVMWEHVGVVRDEPGLRRALEAIADLGFRLERDPVGRAAADASRWITLAAWQREESRGSHFRADHPATRPELARRRFVPTARTVGAA